MKVTDTKTLKTYLGKGRTTTLIEKKTGEILGCWIGILTRAEAYQCYLRDLVGYHKYMSGLEWSLPFKSGL